MESYCRLACMYFDAVSNNNVVRNLGAVFSVPAFGRVYETASIPRSAFIAGQWMQFDLDDPIALFGSSTNLVLRITCQHSLPTDPLAYSAQPPRGQAMIFQVSVQHAFSALTTS